MRKDLPQKLLRELLENSKQSDRQLAKQLDVSQPTITRARHQLEKKGVIQDYTIIPDFKRMGFELMAVNFLKIRPEVPSSEISERINEFLAKSPNTIFASSGEGMGMNAVSISFYRNFTEYNRRVNLVRTEWKSNVEDIQSFIIPLGEGEFKPFSLTYLKDTPL